MAGNVLGSSTHLTAYWTRQDRSSRSSTSRGILRMRYRLLRRVSVVPRSMVPGLSANRRITVSSLTLRIAATSVGVSNSIIGLPQKQKASAIRVRDGRGCIEGLSCLTVRSTRPKNCVLPSRQEWPNSIGYCLDCLLVDFPMRLPTLGAVALVGASGWSAGLGPVRKEIFLPYYIRWQLQGQRCIKTNFIYDLLSITYIRITLTGPRLYPIIGLSGAAKLSLVAPILPSPFAVVCFRISPTLMNLT